MGRDKKGKDLQKAREILEKANKEASKIILGLKGIPKEERRAEKVKKNKKGAEK